MFSHAQDLAGLIGYAVKTYPTIAQAQIEADTAQARIKQSKMAYLPSFGTTVNQTVQSDNNVRTNAVTGSLSLYNGGATQERIRSAKINHEFASHRVDEAGETLANDIANLYMQGLSAKMQLDVQKENLLRYKRIIDKMVVIVSYDRGRRSDLSQAQARMAQVKTQIARLENDVLNAQHQLSKYMPPGKPITWALPSMDVSSDYSGHPSLMASYASERFAESQADIAVKARRPQVDLQMQGGPNKGANLALNWGFFDPVTAAGDDELKNGVRRAQVQTDELKRRLEERVFTAKNSVQQADLTLQTAAAQIAGSKQVIEDFELQFSIARRSMLDVLNAYNELATIELIVAQSIAQKAQAKIQLKFATGKLVDWALRN